MCWGDSVLLAPQVPYGLARLNPFGPPGTLGTCGTQSFQVPRAPDTLGDWRRALSFQAPRYPMDWRDVVQVS